MIFILIIQIKLDETDGRCRNVSSSHFIDVSIKFPVRSISLLWYLIRSNLTRLQALESSTLLYQLNISRKTKLICKLCSIASDLIAPHGKSKRQSTPKTKLSRKSGLSENEIGPGVLESSVQQVCLLHQYQWRNRGKLTKFRLCPCCLKFLQNNIY